MGRIIKRGTKGNAALYVTRNQALKKLQLSLSEFRRLCILKGVHPREPKKKVHGQHKTYYHVKDIQFLLHEPLVNQFRNITAYQKKINRAVAKRRYYLAQELINRQPKYRLDKLVKSRYPSFIDSLRDLDDCLSLVQLFSSLPIEKKYDIPPKAVQLSQKLSLEFQAYVIRVHCLRKVFVSVKGIYFQAEVHNQTVTWITPHNLVQMLPTDVDYRVMLTFLEFYQTLLAFVNYKLYHEIGLKYPPEGGQKTDLTIQSLENLIQDIYKNQKQGTDQQYTEVIMQDKNGKDGIKNQQKDHIKQDNQIKNLELNTEENGISYDEQKTFLQNLAQNQQQTNKLQENSLQLVDMNLKGAIEDQETIICKNLFKGLKFYLGREVPQHTLIFIILSFGGTVGWDGESSPYAENDQGITHHIADRPQQRHRFLNREYIQPQWVFDSANFRVLAPITQYQVGKTLPPHVSPFVDFEEEGYIPDQAQLLQNLRIATLDVDQLKLMQDVDQNVIQNIDGQNILNSEIAQKQNILLQQQEEQFRSELQMEIENQQLDESKLNQKALDLQDKKIDGQPKLSLLDDFEQDYGKEILSRKQRKAFESVKRKEQDKVARIERLQRRKQKALCIG